MHDFHTKQPLNEAFHIGKSDPTTGVQVFRQTGTSSLIYVMCTECNYIDVPARNAPLHSHTMHAGISLTNHRSIMSDLWMDRFA